MTLGLIGRLRQALAAGGSFTPPAAAPPLLPVAADVDLPASAAEGAERRYLNTGEVDILVRVPGGAVVAALSPGEQGAVIYHHSVWRSTMKLNILTISQAANAFTARQLLAHDGTDYVPFDTAALASATPFGFVQRTGDPQVVLKTGDRLGGFSGLTPRADYYGAAGGGITTAKDITLGHYNTRVGRAIDPTTLEIELGSPEEVVTGGQDDDANPPAMVDITGQTSITLTEAQVSAPEIHYVATAPTVCTIVLPDNTAMDRRQTVLHRALGADVQITLQPQAGAKLGGVADQQVPLDGQTRDTLRTSAAPSDDGWLIGG